MLATPSKFQTFGEFFRFFIPSLTGVVGFWATVSLNIPDFTRLARSQRDQIVGQALGPSRHYDFLFLHRQLPSLPPPSSFLAKRSGIPSPSWRALAILSRSFSP